MWSPDESRHIGFTQQYGATLLRTGPQMARLAALPPAIRTGMVASGSMGDMNIESSEGHFHSDFLVAMNKIANRSASAIAEQVIAAGR